MSEYIEKKELESINQLEKINKFQQPLGWAFKLLLIQNLIAVIPLFGAWSYILPLDVIGFLMLSIGLFKISQEEVDNKHLFLASGCSFIVFIIAKSVYQYILGLYRIYIFKHFIVRLRAKSIPRLKNLTEPQKLLITPKFEFLNSWMWDRQSNKRELRC